MSIYNILPIENSGMSVITAMVFFFSSIGLMAVLQWLKERFRLQDEKIEEHDKFVDEIKKEFSDNRVQYTELKGSIQRTQMVVDRIDSSLSDIVKTNTKVIESFLKKNN